MTLLFYCELAHGSSSLTWILPITLQFDNWFPNCTFTQTPLSNPILSPDISHISHSPGEGRSYASFIEVNVVRRPHKAFPSSCLRNGEIFSSYCRDLPRLVGIKRDGTNESFTCGSERTNHPKIRLTQMFCIDSQ
jgi:hypothetical protein